MFFGIATKLCHISPVGVDSPPSMCPEEATGIPMPRTVVEGTSDYKVGYLTRTNIIIRINGCPK